MTVIHTGCRWLNKAFTQSVAISHPSDDQQIVYCVMVKIQANTEIMKRIIGFFGLFLMLATMVVAPVQVAYAAVPVITTSMMQMDDGTPCQQQNCAKMPDCPMALPCLSVSATLAVTHAKPPFQPAVLTLRFAVADPIALPSLTGSGLRRPPKI